MNERIQELAAEAFQVFNKLDENYNEMFEKFAELIVRECAAMTRNLCPHGELAEKAVKQHFGVEL